MTGAIQGQSSSKVQSAFRGAVEVSPGKPSGSASTVSVRLSATEREALEGAAGGKSLSAYIRKCLFGGSAMPSRTSGKRPVKDHEALARVLAALGQSNLSRDLETLRWAEEDGVLVIDPETAVLLQRAAADIAAMRGDLIAALGLRNGGRR